MVILSKLLRARVPKFYSYHTHTIHIPTQRECSSNEHVPQQFRVWLISSPLFTIYWQFKVGVCGWIGESVFMYWKAVPKAGTADGEILDIPKAEQERVTEGWQPTVRRDRRDCCQWWKCPDVRWRYFQLAVPKSWLGDNFLERCSDWEPTREKMHIT